MNEANFDRVILKLLEQENIKVDAQGSSILEISKALQTASKAKTGRAGKPEFVGIVKDYVLVIEDKNTTANHAKYDDNNILSEEIEDIKKYAVNGAIHYGRHIFKNTEYKKIFVFGCSGDEKHYRITPIFIDDEKYYKVLPDIKSFVSFSENNIDKYYTQYVLNEKIDSEKELSEILKDAAVLHEDLRNYGNLKDMDKPIVVSGILLALNEIEHKGFSIDNLNGDCITTDGQKICNAIANNLLRNGISPKSKLDKMLHQFSIIKDSEKLNIIDTTLGKTPLKHYTEFLYSKIFKSIKYTDTSEDYLGRFYGEFMSYSGGDGQTLGIVLTPKHITDLFCELLDIKPEDHCFDPCCGTAGFLVASMYKMLKMAKDDEQKKEIKRNNLHGIELQSYMYSIATTNMILRGDGKSHIYNEDFLKQNPSDIQLKAQPTVGMINPPYSQGSALNSNLYEINFIKHLLDCMLCHGRVAAIVPLSTMTGKTAKEKECKKEILEKHTLEGVITLNKNTFYGVGVQPCIAVFTAGEPHPKMKQVKFIDFTDDGYKVFQHIGLLKQPDAEDKREHLLNVWFNKQETTTHFCVKSTISAEDEWLHSYFYFNDNIPSYEQFENTVNEYLLFEFNTILQGKNLSLELSKELNIKSLPDLNEIQWKPFMMKDIFTFEKGKCSSVSALKDGNIPYVAAAVRNNGVKRYVSCQPKQIQKGNALVFIGNGDGSAGLSVYKQEDFITASGNYVGYNNNINKYIGLFLSTCSDMNESKYSHGNPRNGDRIKRDKIMLPITNNGEPDWGYMEQFIKNIEINKYKQYLQLFPILER